STSQEIIDTMEQNMATSQEIRDNMEKNISTSLEIIDKQRRLITTNHANFCVLSQCFTFFMDGKVNWTDAKAKCEEFSLILAEPSDSVAVPLRKYMVDKFGDVPAWIGAKCDGNQFVFQHSGTALPNKSPLWDDNSPTSGNSGTD
ncbi:unnamed protein product, partial [Meganyctiphanes norvegica]